MKTLFRVFKFLSTRRQIQIFLIFIFIIFSNLAELFSIGAVIPLLAVLTDINILINFLQKNLSVEIPLLNDKNLKTNIIILFVCITLLSGLLRILTQWLISKYSFSIQTDISTKTFNSVINQKYSEHITRNTSEIVTGISVKVSLFRNSLYQFLNTISALFFIFILITSILIINFKAGIFIIGISTVLYSVIWFGCKKIIALHGSVLSYSSNKVTKILQEAMGSIRDILIKSNQSFFTDIFFQSSSKLNSANAKIWFISSSPRIITETLAMILIAIAALYFLGQKGDIVSYIPFLGSLAVAAQRFLPALNNIYIGASTIIANEASVNDLKNLIELPKIKKTSRKNRKILFNHSIELINISFNYKKNLNNVLEDVDFKINKGDWVGIVGKTGSGKTTLVDIIMGLLHQNSGKILIDGHILTEGDIPNWQKYISHVPQNIFLSDLSIQENIAFGINNNDIDILKVKKLVKRCNLHELVEQLPEKLMSKVGEKGVKLSGGQIQRIAIARALYTDPELIVLDEATSGLDSITERKIIDTIDNIPKNVTILMITHNQDILAKCTKIINVENGKLNHYQPSIKN